MSVDAPGTLVGLGPPVPAIVAAGLPRMMSERRWRVTARDSGLFAMEVDDGGGFWAATAAEVDAALRQRELFGAAEYPVQRVDAAERPGDEVDVG